MRTFLLAGNWKMHGSREMIAGLLSDLKAALPADDFNARCEMALIPPMPYLAAVAADKPEAVSLGAQNLCSESGQGAYTGEVSGDMLRDMDCRYVLVGHSERRALYGESDAVVAEKVKAALDQGLRPVVCVGETEAQREAEQTLAVIGEQLDAVLNTLAADQLEKLVWAYEPVWAIGTGKTATPDQAEAVHAFMRDKLKAAQGEAAEAMQILYGGSVKAANAAELFAQPNIDGGLVGGASLDAAEFAAIYRAAVAA